MQATQWMNRTAQGPKWKPESAALRSRLSFACICVPQLCVLPQSTGLSPRCKKWVSKCETKGEKLWARTEKVSVPLVQTVLVNLQKKTVLVEIDTWTRKQKANEKNNPCRSSKRVLSKRIPNPLKLSIQGHPGEMRQARRRATTWMSRTILGKRPALAAEGEKQVFSSPNSVLISPSEHPNDLWTQPKVFSEEKASRLPPIRSLFFHHYDWNRWFASLATTVDNTIKMADRSFKHGRQWCIRRNNKSKRPVCVCVGGGGGGYV